MSSCLICSLPFALNMRLTSSSDFSQIHMDLGTDVCTSYDNVNRPHVTSGNQSIKVKSRDTINLGNLGDFYVKFVF